MEVVEVEVVEVEVVEVEVVEVEVVEVELAGIALKTALGTLRLVWDLAVKYCGVETVVVELVGNVVVGFGYLGV